jgi:hypothetical protein
MKEIDWSKAPEGATHFDTRGNCCSIGFMKPGVRRGEWEYFGMDGHWILYGPVDSALKAAMVKRPTDTSWTGEGLPPVGVECEVKNDINDGWDRVDEVLAHTTIKGAVVAVFKRDDRVFYSPADAFRPIRTPEQIAAEEREKEVDQMVQRIAENTTGIGIGAAMICAKALHAAGYRKVTP